MKHSQKLLIVISITIITLVSVGMLFVLLRHDKQVSLENPIKYELLPTADIQHFYPQLIEYEDAEVMTKVNRILEHSLKNSPCGEVKSELVHFAPIFSISVDYAKNDIFNVHMAGTFDCGGAYPINNYLNSLTFDLKTSEEPVTFEQLFKDYEKDKKQILAIIYSDVIARTSDYISKYGETSDANCGRVNTLETLSEYPQNFILSSSTPSIFVSPSYPHVMEACIERVEVPVMKLLPFADTNSILNRL